MESERSFFGVFNTFVNQRCEKLDQNVLNLALRLLLLPEFLKYWILPHIKKFNFRHYRETKMLQIIVFWSNHEIKLPRNVVFRLNREIKMPRN